MAPSEPVASAGTVRDLDGWLQSVSSMGIAAGQLFGESKPELPPAEALAKLPGFVDTLRYEEGSLEAAYTAAGLASCWDAAAP